MVILSKIAASSDSSLPKWQIALIVSIPVAFGLGYLYYCRNKSINKVVVSENGGSSINVISNNVIKEKPDVLQNKPTKNLTPLEAAENLKTLGNNLFRNSEYYDAIKYYTEAINTCPLQENPTLSTLYQNRAAAYEKLNDLNKVIEDCTKALDLNGRYVKAVLRRAKAYEKRDELDKALEDLALASFIETSNNSEIIADFERVGQREGHRYAENVLEGYSSQSSNLPSKYFVKTYLSTFTHGSAIDKLNTSDETNAKLLNLFKKAEDTLMSCKGEEAESLCNELINQAREANNSLMEMEGLVLRGTLFTLLKRNIEALNDLTLVIDNPDADSKVKVNALIKRATVYNYISQPEKCFEDFYKAEQLDENNPDIYHHLGQIYLIRERLTDSVNSFRKSATLYPEFAIFVIQHCFVEYKYAQVQGDTELAEHFLNEFKNLLDRFPDNIECRTMYSQILAERNEYTAAEELFNSAIREQPDHAALYVHKALMLLQWKGYVKEATRLIKKALKLDSSCEFAYETLATIEAQLGHFHTALQYYDQAISHYSSLDELTNLCCARIAVYAQFKAAERLGIYVGPKAELIGDDNE